MPDNPAPAAASTLLLEARALSFQRQHERVFGPLDFRVHAGELALIEGDNGSGKTTLMRILTGLLHAQEGELRWRENPLHWDHCAGEVLFLGHQLGLKGELDARENLAYLTRLHGQYSATAVDQALQRVGLAGYEEEPVRTLSAGQKKRVALCRLLLIPAVLWLLDEPYANLDRTGIALVNTLLAAHVAAGGAALVSSHGAVPFFDGATPRRIHLHA